MTVTDADPIEKLLVPPLAGMGYRLVRARLTGSGHKTLQVLVEREAAAAAGDPGDGGITVGDCADISRAVSTVLDVHDPVRGGYDLEVSSPGMDRPLVTNGDFERFAGFEAKLETRDLIDGRRRFRGTLKGIAGGDVEIDLGRDAGTVLLPLASVVTAHLVVTDALIAATLKSNSKRKTRQELDA